MSVIHLPNGAALTIEQEAIDITPESRPDFRWSFRDAQGHVHQWDTSAPWWESTVPTIRWSWDRRPDPDDEWDPGEGRYRCIQCRATVPNPATLWNEKRVFVGGLRSARLEDYPCDGEEMLAAFEDGRTVSINLSPQQQLIGRVTALETDSVSTESRCTIVGRLEKNT